jgi:hypothetical protein
MPELTRMAVFIAMCVLSGEGAILCQEQGLPQCRKGLVGVWQADSLTVPPHCSVRYIFHADGNYEFLDAECAVRINPLRGWGGKYWVVGDSLVTITTYRLLDVGGEIAASDQNKCLWTLRGGERKRVGQRPQRDAEVLEALAIGDRTPSFEILGTKYFRVPGCLGK